jgi:hypothetical protein
MKQDEYLKDVEKGSIVEYGNKTYIYLEIRGTGAKLMEVNNPKKGLYTSKYSLVGVIKESEIDE